MPEAPKYDAFISYRHLPLDKKVAVRLQKRLEGYTPPRAVAGDFKRFRVFRDETERKTLKKLDMEYIRIAATLLDHDFEDLCRRGQRRALRRAVAAGTAAAAVLLGIIVYGAFMLHYANQQRALAEQNTEEAARQATLAEQSLEQARPLIASGALDYALALNGQGARTRSAAVLNHVYGKLDPAWDNAGELATKFRDAALGALYYDANSVYASLSRPDEVLDVFYAPGGATAVVVVNRSVCAVEVATGKVTAEFGPPEGDCFTATALYGDTLLCGLQSGGLLAADPATGATTLHENVCATAVERLAWRPEAGAVLLLGSEVDMAANTEALTLTVVQAAGGGFGPQAEGRQSFTLLCGVRGGISARHSFSQNGRWLAAKKNVDISVDEAGVYSFSSQRLVLRFGTIASANGDVTTVYLSGSGAPVSLLPEELYARLKQLPGLTGVFGEDASAAGVGVL